MASVCETTTRILLPRPGKRRKIVLRHANCGGELKRLIDGRRCAKCRTWVEMDGPGCEERYGKV